MKGIWQYLKAWCNDILAFVYPNICVSCETERGLDNQVFCLNCQAKILETDHFENPQNELLFRLSGRVEVQHGAALYGFIKQGVIQKAIHQLKYRGRYDIAQKFGERLAEKMIDSQLMIEPDIIIPIPIHKSRRKKRGYNQSEEFAIGITKVLPAQIETACLIKNKQRVSQTSKGREDRFENVLSSFELKDRHKIEGKCVLLVDDVMTTGATIEAAIKLLKEVPGIKLQLGIMALANG